MESCGLGHTRVCPNRGLCLHGFAGSQRVKNGVYKADSLEDLTRRMDIGSRIQKIRGKTPRAVFAEQLGIHPQTLYMYEKGKRVVDVELVQLLCAKFGVPVEWLIFGEGQLQAVRNDEEDQRLQRELAAKEARIAELQNELIAAQAGALKAYELAVGALHPAKEANTTGNNPTPSAEE